MLSAKKRKAANEAHGTKRSKELSAFDQEDKLRDITLFLEGSHPYGLKPWGNFFHEEDQITIRESSLGKLKVLTDEILLNVLDFCSPYHLLQLAASSRVLYIFSHHEDLWRAITLKELNGKFDFSNTWKETYCRHQAGDRYRDHRPIKVSGFLRAVLLVIMQ